MRSKAGEGDSLGNVVNDIGTMNESHYDNAPEQVRKNAEFMTKVCKYNIKVSTTNP